MLTVKGDPNIRLVGYGPVLPVWIVPDVSKYRNAAAFFSVKLDPEKDEGTTIRRNVRNHSPPRLGRLGSFPLTTANLLREFLCHVELPHSHVFYHAQRGGGMAKQEGLLASLAWIEGLQVVTLARSFKAKCRYFIYQTHFFSYKPILNPLLF